ncbi:phage morphogenesis protein [Parabacteroides merdae]|jgi:phage gpG-like protein|nr:phage morphogenesis protein [Parabacteroides merdae]DAY51082.1 MAG TPA: virion morphogenesis protein [Caudoviricetes sp.]
MSSNTFFNNVLKDIQTELVDEFDLNFERKAFFDRPWAPLSKNYQPTGGSMLLRTGALRRSIRSRISGTSLIYSSSLRYAGLMNYGGTVRQDFVPTPKMRRWAWANFHALQQSGKTSEAEKYRRMALAKRIRRTFTVPARPFVGDHPRVQEIARDIVSEHAARAIEEETRQFPKYRNK